MDVLWDLWFLGFLLFSFFFFSLWLRWNILLQLPAVWLLWIFSAFLETPLLTSSVCVFTCKVSFL